MGKNQDNSNSIINKIYIYFLKSRIIITCRQERPRLKQNKSNATEPKKESGWYWTVLKRANYGVGLLH